MIWSFPSHGTVLHLCPKVQDMHLLQNEEINTKEVTEPPDYEEQRTLDNTTLLMCKPIQSTDVSRFLVFISVRG